MCLLAARSAAACKRTRAVVRVGGAATGVDARVAAGWDEREQRVCRRGRDDRYAWPSDNRVTEVSAVPRNGRYPRRRDWLARNRPASKPGALSQWLKSRRGGPSAPRLLGSRGCSGLAMPLPRKGTPARTDADDRFDDSLDLTPDARLQRQAAADVSGRWVLTPPWIGGPGRDRAMGQIGRGQLGCAAPVGRARRRGLPAGLTQCVSRSPLAAGIVGAGRSWTACTISVLSMPRKYTDVTPRSACPSCRWMTTSGTPSRDISTA